MGFFKKIAEIVNGAKEARAIKNGEDAVESTSKVASQADLAQAALQRARDHGLRPDEYFDFVNLKSAKAAELAGKDPKKWQQVHDAEQAAEKAATSPAAKLASSTTQSMVNPPIGYPQTGLAGITTPIVHEISSAIRNFNPLSKKILGTIGLGYVLAIDVPFTEGTDPLLKTGYQNIQKMTNGQWDAEWQKDNAGAKQADQLARAQQGAVLTAQNAGASFITGASNAPSIDQMSVQFNQLLSSQASAKPEALAPYTTRFKRIMEEQIDQNRDSMLQPIEGKGLLSSQHFADLMNDLPVKDEQKAYIVNSLVTMNGLKR